MTGLLDPTFKEVRIGAAQVRETFKTPKFGTIAGCMVTRRHDHAVGRHAGATASRQRRHLRRQDRVAAPLQGRRVRGQGRVRVRHRLREVQRHEGRRHDRGLRRRARRDSCIERPRRTMASSRPERIGDQIRVEITGMLRRQVHDPGIGFLTVTRVKVSADLQQARVSTTRRWATRKRAGRPAARWSARPLSFDVSSPAPPARRAPELRSSSTTASRSTTASSRSC